jgi:hypothetical protein
MSSGSGGMPEGALRAGRAAALIVVAAVVAIVLLHHSPSTPAVTAAKSVTTAPPTTVAAGHHSSTATTSTTVPSSTTVASTVPAAQVKVLVLNGASFSQPLASAFTTKVKADGYATLAPNNATTTVASSVIYVITAGYTPEANALAAKLGLTAKAVQTAVPAGSPLPAYAKTSGANLVLVVGPDLATKA